VTIFGWDASDYDWTRGSMNLSRARADGIDFFSHKATEGTHTHHTHMGEALNRARSAGIPLLGTYVVVRTPGNAGNGSITQQVEYYLSYLNSQISWWRDHPGFFHQVDLEKWSYDAVSASQGLAMVDRLTAVGGGKKVVLYAPSWAYGTGSIGSAPRWESKYGNNPAVAYRLAYPGDGSSRWMSNITLLQYGSKTIIGSQPTCDASAFRGTLAQLQSILGTTQQEVPDMADYGSLGNPNYGTDQVQDTWRFDHPDILAADVWSLLMRGVGAWSAQEDIHPPLNQLPQRLDTIMQDLDVISAKLDDLIVPELTDDQVTTIADAVAARITSEALTTAVAAAVKAALTAAATNI